MQELEPCNKCGEKNSKQIKIRHGYNTKHDNEVWRFNLCEDCMDKFMIEYERENKTCREVEKNTFEFYSGEFNLYGDFIEGFIKDFKIMPNTCRYND